MLIVIILNLLFLFIIDFVLKSLGAGASDLSRWVVCAVFIASMILNTVAGIALAQCGGEDE